MKQFQPMKSLYLDFHGKFSVRENSLFIDKIDKSTYQRKHEKKITANELALKSRTK